MMMAASLDDGFSAHSIMKIINEIKNDRSGTSEGQRIQYYKNKHPEFYSKFPKLFFAALDPTFDTKYLSLMLKQRDMMIEKKDNATFDDINKQVHEDLNEKYVYPVIPKEQIMEAMEKEKEKQKEKEKAIDDVTM